MAAAATVAMGEVIASRRDPVAIARARLDRAQVAVIDRHVADEVDEAVRVAREGLGANRA